MAADMTMRIRAESIGLYFVMRSIWTIFGKFVYMYTALLTQDKQMIIKETMILYFKFHKLILIYFIHIPFQRREQRAPRVAVRRRRPQDGSQTISTGRSSAEVHMLESMRSNLQWSFKFTCIWTTFWYIWWWPILFQLLLYPNDFSTSTNS